VKLFILLLIFPNLALAASGTYKSVSYTLEPVYGREKIRIDKEASAASTEYFYGARLSATYKIFNIEGEYTRTDRGNIFASEPGLSEGFEVERIKLGLFGTYQLYPKMLTIIRGGVDAKKTTILSLSNNNLVETELDRFFRPYLGLGIEVGYKMIALTSGVTVVFHGFPDYYAENDYQFSFGIKLRI
jgi:hypothetical protein